MRTDQLYFQRITSRLDRKLKRLVPAGINRAWLKEWIDTATGRDTSILTHAIARPARELLDQGGKRWRPLFGILLLEMMAARSEPYELLLSALTELCHTGALIIDDIEDGSRLRRGKPCIHTTYGLATAINAANALYFLPLTVISRHKKLDSGQKSAIYEIMARQFVRAHLGQAADLYWAGRIAPAWKQKNIEQLVLQAYADKTAAVVEGVSEIAAVIARAPVTQQRQAAAFGRSFGVAFQIIDDVLDMRGFFDKRHLRGEDIENAKLSFVLVRALRQLKRGPRRRLLSLLADPRRRGSTQGKREAVELIRCSGSIADASRYAQDLYRGVWAKFSRVFPDSKPKQRLHALCEQLMAQS